MCICDYHVHKVTRWCGDWTGSFENFNSDLRNVSKRLRKNCKRKDEYTLSCGQGQGVPKTHSRKPFQRINYFCSSALYVWHLLVIGKAVPQLLQLNLLFAVPTGKFCHFYTVFAYSTYIGKLTSTFGICSIHRACIKLHSNWLHVFLSGNDILLITNWIDLQIICIELVSHRVWFTWKKQYVKSTMHLSSCIAVSEGLQHTAIQWGWIHFLSYREGREKKQTSCSVKHPRVECSFCYCRSLRYMQCMGTAARLDWTLARWEEGRSAQSLRRGGRGVVQRSGGGPFHESIPEPCVAAPASLREWLSRAPGLGGIMWEPHSWHSI